MHAPSSEWHEPLIPRDSKCSRCVRERCVTAAAASVTPDRAISCARVQSSERPAQLKLPRVSAAALIESVADAAAAASVTPDRAISGLRDEKRAAYAA